MDAAFGALVRKQRRRADLTQEQLAGSAMVSPATVRRIEGGQPVERQSARAVITALDQENELASFELRDLAASYLIPEMLTPERPDTKVMGVVVPNVPLGAFWALLVAEIEAHCLAQGYLIALCQHRDNMSRQADYLDFLGNTSGTVGVAIAPACGWSSSEQRRWAESLTSRIVEFRSRGIPLVVFDRRMATRLRLPYVGIDNRYAARIAVDHLIELGHDKIGALFYFRHLSNQAERFSGYVQALRDHGLEFNEAWVKFEPGAVTLVPPDDRTWFRRHRGHAQAKELVATIKHGGPTGVFCGTWFHALAILHEAQEARLRIPEDISVIAFDDVPELDTVQPAMARVHYDLRMLAQRTVDRVLALLDDPQDRSSYADDIIGGESIKITPGSSVLSQKIGRAGRIVTPRTARG